MERRTLLGLVAAGLALSAAGCGASRVDAMTGSVLVSGLSAREVRELARSHGMLGKAPLQIEMRRALQPGGALPPNLVFHPIPPAMLEDMPMVDGHEWRIAGIDLLLVDSGTMVISDILRGPFR